MARKFKAGDKVKIVRDLETKNMSEHGLRLGRVGIVDHINPSASDDCPYCVQLRSRVDTNWFNARELELISRKGNK